MLAVGHSIYMIFVLISIYPVSLIVGSRFRELY